jgi:hypothetical protein
MLRQLANSPALRRSLSGVRTYSAEAAGGQVLVHMGGVFSGGALFIFWFFPKKNTSPIDDYSSLAAQTPCFLLPP